MVALLHDPLDLRSVFYFFGRLNSFGHGLSLLPLLLLGWQRASRELTSTRTTVVTGIAGQVV
jgi:hypothetical protein